MVANPGADLVDRLLREAQTARLRARNGLRMASGRRPRRTGLSAKEVVWRRGNTELWRYVMPEANAEGPVIVLIHSLVSRSYVLDLQPGNSLVEELIAGGGQVFLLDWGSADARDAANTLETYVDDLMPDALRVVHELTQQRVHLVGYCLGGILTLLYSARHPDAPVDTITTLATPIDFSDLGMVVSMLRDGRLEVDDLLDESGNIPSSVFRQAFRVMQPTAEVNQFVNLLQNLWNDEFVDSYEAMSAWVSDHIPFPGGVAKQATQLLIRQNALYNGTLELGGRKVDLGAITCPVLCVLAERDHIVPLGAATPLLRLVTSAGSHELRLSAGHVALVMGKQAKRVTVPAVFDHIRQHSQL